MYMQILQVKGLEHRAQCHAHTNIWAQRGGNRKKTRRQNTRQMKGARNEKDFTTDDSAVGGCTGPG